MPGLTPRVFARRVGPTHRRREDDLHLAADRMAYIGAKLERFQPAAKHRELVDGLRTLIALTGDARGEPIVGLRLPMRAKPKHLGPEYAAQFADQSVAAAYHNRIPYPPDVFAILAGLLAGLTLSAQTFLAPWQGERPRDANSIAVHAGHSASRTRGPRGHVPPEPTPNGPVTAPVSSIS